MNRFLCKKLNKTSQDVSYYSGAVAVQFHESFDALQTYQLEEFQQNLSRLESKISFLSFMLDEVKEVLDRDRSSSDISA